MPTALITGISGQDGAYRRTSSVNFWRIAGVGR
ncbi:hypothetical protein EV192_101237 [Actinocrispum wychmicini]|uniref:Uncharacterized protein n=1 Tax=Actinocrispum wychmicini TaxID=1213861 RepID=A0A4R2JVH3_9PSEU|nr:hypothetical protein EV192_101237 [Actinocrispum wychmicini]